MQFDFVFAMDSDQVAEDSTDPNAPIDEPEEKQMTLDEWKQLEEQRRVKAAFNIRKPGEGCSSDPKWKKMYKLKKKEDEHEEEVEDDEVLDC